MAAFLERLRIGLRACGCEDGRVLLAVSGGADSVALLRGIAQLRKKLRVSPVVAHLNHKLRGAAADEDAAWLGDLCGRLGVPFVLGEQDVAQAAAAAGRGIEETARAVRYRFLEEAAREQSCAQIAVAHTADDQAETILHHVIRGTGLAGLRGMPSRRPLAEGIELVRPLLEISRAESEVWLAEIGQDYRTDVTNQDERFTRNRLRNSLMPLVRRDFNPQVAEALNRLGRQAADVQEAVEFCARRLLGDAVLERGELICRLRCEPLAAAPRHLVRTSFVLLWQDLDWPRQGMGFDEWERLAEVVRSGGAVVLPSNTRARRRGNLLVLQRQHGPDEAPAR